MPRLILRPLQAFLSTATAGGTLLLLAAAVALAWANSPWGDAYEDLWGTEFALGLGRWTVEEDLRHWVNDGLMTIFFLVVGLEIKREFLTGELRDRRAAALPIIAALGGMVAPAAIYLALNAGGEGAHGWGIPMATDIAFALGVLLLAARHAPAGLKPFVLTLAIVDDIGAIVVIALFYSTGVSIEALALAATTCGLMLLLHRVGVRAQVVFVVLGLVVWVLTSLSGVHPTIAGVVLGLLTPAQPFQRPHAVSAAARRIADLTKDDPEPPDADAHYWLGLSALAREAVSPLARAEHVLLPWSSFVILPIFALANAGVQLSADRLAEAATSPITLGVLLGLVLGKSIGIGGISAIALRIGIARLPAGVRFRHLSGAAIVAGVGFTVSLFIAELAFDDRALVDEAKIGVLGASLIAGVAGWLALRGSPAVSEPLADAEDDGSPTER
ncbi:MAG TPA: Na+/H+ antiporter NhaA [Actinomycetota bacterium]|nr:Na+/H+ antiporter NhaA [Actinomycetota bacterium]